MTVFYKRNADILDLFPKLHNEPVIMVPNLEEVIKVLFIDGTPSADLSLYHNLVDKKAYDSLKGNSSERIKKLVESYKTKVLKEYFKGDETLFKMSDMYHDCLGVLGERFKLNTMEETKKNSLFFFFRFIGIHNDKSFKEMEIAITFRPVNKLNICMLLAYVSRAAYEEMKKIDNNPIDFELETFAFSFDHLDMIKIDFDPLLLELVRAEDHSCQKTVMKTVCMSDHIFETIKNQDEETVKNFFNSYGDFDFQTSSKDDQNNDLDYLIDLLNEKGVFMSDGVFLKKLRK